MSTDPFKAGTGTIGTLRSRTVTPEMVHARVAELAFIDGRLSSETTMSDFARAKRELTGEPDPGTESTRS
ncbi:MAG: hypothetical protein P4N60_23860 [Verrucomicrobiae bacterium]|nr:hypothetical protein [Verrucomicrobiae bacterium]